MLILSVAFDLCCSAIRRTMRRMKLTTSSALVALAVMHAPVHAEQPHSAHFNSTLSNTTPLAYGMTADAAAAALGTPLTYVKGKPGHETFVVVRKVNGNGFSYRDDPLFLQFRNGRLTGWKGDWNRNWMWQ
jgi:hypothetical protein